jgi:S1-C subfamily serine protease
MDINETNGPIPEAPDTSGEASAPAPEQAPVASPAPAPSVPAALEPAPAYAPPAHPVAAPAPPVHPAAPQPEYTPRPAPVPAPAPAPAGKPPRHGHAGIVAAAVAIALVFGAAAGVAGGYVAYRYLPGRAEGPQQVELIGDTTEEVVAAAALVAVPSVVNIDVVGEAGSGTGTPSGHPDVPLQGEGSGVAYKETDDDGTFIITNNHVVEGATTIVVTDSTGESYDAELVGADSETDIAVVKVNVSIPVIELGDSDDLVVGQTAIAIGSPFGLEASVTSGVISALQRPLTDFGGDEGQYPYVGSIQTDAAINPGNSGGALVDREGRLIGIPSAIYSDTGVSDGVGLAIPVRAATRAADELIEKGRVDTPFLGILGQTVTPAFAEQENLPVDEGAYIAEVTAGTEAEKAGLRTGDIIVRLDDTRIRSMDELILAVRQQTVGDTVTLKIWRDGKELEIDMKVGIKPSNLATD